MSVTLYAQPYDLSAQGFYFETVEEYHDKAADLVNAHGQPVEEFEIQFIEGSSLDAAFADAFCLYQSSIGRFFTLVEDWSEHQKTLFIIAVSESGYDADQLGDDPEGSLDVDLYEDMTLRELAEQFVDEGLFGEIPERLQFYIDYDAIARDLGHDYTETEIAGKRFIYRLA